MSIPNASIPLTKWNNGRASDAWYLFLSQLAGGAVTAADADALNGQPGTYYLDLGNATGTLAASRLASNARNLSANDTAAAGDFCDVDATAGAVVITIPDASINSGRFIIVAKNDASANTVTLSGTINGGSVILTAQYACALIVSNGPEWRLA